MMELLAIIHGMSIAVSKKVEYVLICWECKEAITLINQDMMHTDINSYALSVCREYKQVFKEVKFNCYFIKK